MIDKRINARNLTADTILAIAKFDGKRTIGRIVNVSAGGGALLSFPESIGVAQGTRFDVTFAIPLNNGNVFKLHFKSAIVIHITNGKIGVITGQRDRSNTLAAA
jgi:hypothetical protein